MCASVAPDRQFRAASALCAVFVDVLSGVFVACLFVNMLSDVFLSIPPAELRLASRLGRPINQPF